MDLRSSTKRISTLESNEQQRKWTDEHLAHKAADPLSNYDPTRAHLNFEVTKGGVVQPIDKSRTINERMDDIMRERGIKDPDDRPDAKMQHRVLAQIIFGGNTPRMREIAFGKQKVNFKKGADNSGITRTKDIEQWAQDVYNFAAKRFGEENIVSFYVHLDEKSPHAHCTILPVNKDNKLSYRDVFGHSLKEESDNMNNMHDMFFLEVGNQWGLDRGSNMAETKSKHRSTEEYKRDLVREVEELQDTVKGLREQVRRNEIKLKGLTTMLEHHREEREKIQSEIDLIAAQFGMEGADTSELAKHMAELRKKLADIDDKIARHTAELEKANDILAKAQRRLQELTGTQERLQEIVGDLKEQSVTKDERDIFAKYIYMINDAFRPVEPKLTYDQRTALEDSGFLDLHENFTDIIVTACHLVGGYIEGATTYLESHCGSSPVLDCKRKDDEDDEDWWKRCIVTAARAVKSTPRRGRKR